MKTSLLSGLSPLVLFLTFSVAIPSIGVLWFMLDSIENERIATQTKFTALYQRHGQQSRESVLQQWYETLQHWDSDYEQRGTAVFQDIVKNPMVSTAVLWDTNSATAYPRTVKFEMPPRLHNSLWQQARQAEFASEDWQTASQLYKTIATQSHGYEQLLAEVAYTRILYKNKNLTDVLAQTVSLLTLCELSPKTSKSIIDLCVSMSSHTFATAMSANEPSNDHFAIALGHWLRDTGTNYTLDKLDTSQRQTIISLLEEYKEQAEITLPEWWKRAEYQLPDRPHSIDTLSNIPKHIWLHSGSEHISVSIPLEVLAQQIAASFHENVGETYATVILGATTLASTAEILYQSNIVELGGIPIVIIDNSPSWQGFRNQQAVFGYWLTGIAVIALLVISSAFAASRIRKQEKLNQLKSDVMATVSHELRTPLSSMRLLLDNMQADTSQLSQRHTEYLQILSTENQRLTRLVNNFLAFSRIDRKKYPFEFTELNVNDWLETLLENSRHKLEWQGVSLAYELPDVEISIDADEDNLSTALLNILENASKYSESPQEISLRLSVTDTHCHIAVTDKGIGIAKDQLPHIFKQFYRVDQYLHRETEGCGLGLYITQHIIEAHNGSIDVDSELGNGSTFTLSLPRYN